VSESQNIALVWSLMEAFDRGDFDAQLAILDPGVEIVEWPEGPDQRTNVYTVRDGKVTRIEFFTTREPAFRAAGLDASARSEESA
jgi:ketosteroid isomerase-like protein